MSKIPQFIATICLLLFLFSPLSVLASELPAPETPINLISVFYFGDQNDGLLAIIAPIEEDLFVWAYFNPHAVTTTGSTNYTYDDNGNLTGDGTYTYTWDYNNRLISSIAGDATYNYYYDNEGNRVKKVQGANTTIYVSKYYEIDPSGKITKHIYGGDDRVALIETVSGIKTTYYVHKDHLGGSSIITDSSGNQVELIDYHPYGTTRLDQKSGSFENTHKFTGKELDSETGLYYYGQRYYDPEIGRFVSEDPAYLAVGDEDKLKGITKLDLAKYLANPQLENSYSYAGNNPLKFVDKEGEWLDTVIDVGFIVNDIYRVGSALLNGGDVKGEMTSLGLDVGSAFVPGIVGLGAIARDARMVNSITDVSVVRNTIEAGRIGQAKLGFPSVKAGEAGGSTAGKRISDSVKQQAFNQSAGKCVFCGLSTTNARGPLQSQGDHAIPRVQGGNATINNTQNTCRTCNLQKGPSSSSAFINRIMSGINSLTKKK